MRPFRTPPTQDPIPPELEERVLRILDGDGEPVAAALGRLLRENPDRAAAILDWMRRVAADASYEGD